ncbi:site-specific integrase [Streptomyces sp. NPDC048489]|uniref:tyrosine-type recombinase/integrase n=1 Tax=Streptomyces sp. NPDC048489 TaxID=3154504 RepID=UPI00342E907A
MTRRSNGEGTYYQRKDGRWEGAAYFETVSGQRKRLRVYGNTQTEARQELAKKKADAHNGVLLADKAWRLEEYLDYWLEKIVKNNRRPATYNQCKGTARRYLKPSLGKYKLTALTVPLVQSFLDERLANHSVENVIVMRKVLSAALTSAMREEHLQRNVARLTQLPTSESKEVEPWTIDESRRFLEVAGAHPLYPAFLILLFYGLREGEVLGLQWRDFDFERNELYVRHQVQRGYSGTLELSPLKTKRSKRPLPLLNFVRSSLLSHRHTQQREQAENPAWGTDTRVSGLAFTNELGGPMEASRIRQAFYKVCDEHRIRRIRVHDTRHGVATLLAEFGAPIKEVQLILGHANATTTQRVYTHGSAKASREWLEVLESALTAKQKDDRTPGDRLNDDGGSRQFSRQVALLGATFTTSNFGGATGTRTLDLFHAMAHSDSLIDRTTEVNKAMTSCRRSWLVGVVAVNLAVKTSTKNKEESHDQAS